MAGGGKRVSVFLEGIVHQSTYEKNGKGLGAGGGGALVLGLLFTRYYILNIKSTEILFF